MTPERRTLPGKPTGSLGGRSRHRGYILLVVLVTVTVVTGVFTVFQSALNFGAYSRFHAWTDFQLKWAAEGALVERFHQWKSGRVSRLNEQGELRRGTDRQLRLRIREKETAQPWPLLQISARASLKNRDFRTSLLAIRRHYSDFVIASAGELVLRGLAEGSRFYFGPIHSNGDLLVEGNGLRFYGGRGSNPVLTSLGRVRALSEQSLLNPNLVGRGEFRLNWENPLAEAWREEDLSGAVNSGSLVVAGAGQARALSDFGVDELVRHAEEFVSDEYNLSFGNRGILPISTLINPYLLEKDLIGLGNGNKRGFGLPTGRPKPDKVYLRNLEEVIGQELGLRKNYKVHPVRDAPDPTGSSVTIHNGGIRFSKENWEARLKLNRDHFARLGRIRIRDGQFSQLTPGRPVLSLKIGFGVNALKLEPSDYHIDWRRGYIQLHHNGVINSIWQEAGVTDGSSKVYDHSVGGGLAALVGGRLVEALVGNSEIVFDAIPPPGETIHILAGKPDVFARLGPPGFQTGVLVDRQIRALDLYLSELIPRPDYGLIVSRVPLRVYGNPLQPVTIFCTEDVYLGRINHDRPGGPPVVIVSGGMVWPWRDDPENEEKLFSLKTNLDHLQQNNVLVLSGGDDWPLLSRRPMAGGSLATLLKPERHLFRGSLFLAGRRRNLSWAEKKREEYTRRTVNYELPLDEYYYFHPLQNTDFIFYHSPVIAGRTRLPEFVPVSLRLLNWKRQPLGGRF